MTGPRGQYLDQIRQSGVFLSSALADAFARVPREVFVPDGFQRRDGRWALPTEADFLATVYRDDVLVTKVDGEVPVSSSSQPSLMALMIEALDVRPGQRILEIGAGTGYNAALLAALGAEVISVDVQEDVADRARSALARAGIEGVRVEHGDGYAGFPGVRVDRVIVSVAIGGISPRWLGQLAPDGIVVAPIAHAGFDPVHAVVQGPGGEVGATVVTASSFMLAAGPLTADHPGAFPPPAAPGVLAGFAEYAGPRFPPLDPVAYRDLWFAAGVWNRRATRAAVPRREQACLVLLDEPRTGGAVILPDGTVLAGGEQAAVFAADAVALLDRWLTAGRPAMGAWRVGLTPAGDPAAPILVPASWELA